MRSGFSIIKNGDSLGYPYLEALKSLAPLVDELVVAHGDSTDKTAQSLEQLRSEIHCPLKVIDSPWNKKNIRGGSELAAQTNVALEACAHEICFYIQADELTTSVATSVYDAAYGSIDSVLTVRKVYLGRSATVTNDRLSAIAAARLHGP